MKIGRIKCAPGQNHSKEMCKDTHTWSSSFWKMATTVTLNIIICPHIEKSANGTPGNLQTNHRSRNTLGEKRREESMGLGQVKHQREIHILVWEISFRCTMFSASDLWMLNLQHICVNGEIFFWDREYTMVAWCHSLNTELLWVYISKRSFESKIWKCIKSIWDLLYRNSS